MVYGGDLCRIAMFVNTTTVSGITLEAWLPLNWHGRFLAVGNGGLSGCIYYEDIAYGASLGFATVGSNNGHNGTSGKPFYKNPEVVKDFAYRAVHTSAVIGKQITNIFYGQNYTYSYWLGCSTGGRQGLKSAQAFPDDFNGIAAGAPAIDQVALHGWSGWQGILAGFDNTTSSFITRSQWVSIQQEVLRQCDKLDGAEDGLLEDPSLCYPKISPLLCNQTSNASTCLTGEQATRVTKMFSDLYSDNDTLIYPRMQPGIEVDSFNVYRAGTKFQYLEDWFRYVVYNDPNWDLATLSLSEIQENINADLYGIASSDADLSSFQATDGKIIMFHGSSDGVISSLNSIRYYESVVANMSMSPSELDSFFRFFRISGMGHCRRGPGGPWDVANKYTGRPIDLNTPENNILLAMVKWVEDGQAPDTLTGYGYGSSNTAGKIQVARMHCKYPARNIYVGPGNNTDKAAWKCV